MGLKMFDKSAGQDKECIIEPDYYDMQERVDGLCYVPEKGTMWYPPVQVSGNQLGKKVLDTENVRKAVLLNENLEPDDYTEYLTKYYKDGLEKFGQNWEYADIVTVLIGLSEIIKPQRYLEIGVRRGRSVCAVASETPDCDIYMFDRWSKNYAGMENPGPEFVESELIKTGHNGKREFRNGNSHTTLKEFFRENSDISFDLMTVDGDHSYEGAAEDMCDVLPHLRIGGAVVFDDISHPKHLYLYDLWKKMIGDNPRFTSWCYRDVGYGVGLAIRKW